MLAQVAGAALLLLLVVVHGLPLPYSALRASSCGVCPLDAPGAVANFSFAALDVVCAPTGNSPTTWTTLNVQGVTGQDDEREYMVNLGLVSNRGVNSRPTPYHDKVTLYAAIVAENGTGDVWAMNPLVTQSAGSGDYNAQGIELDFNNENAHRGEEDAGAGLAPPVSYGLSVTGAAPYRSTSAILVSGSGRIWNRGITFANDCIQQSTFQDLGNGGKSIDIRGSPTYGVYQASPTTQNYFAGKTGVGLGTEHPLATLHVGGAVHVEGPVVTSLPHPAFVDTQGQPLRLRRSVVLSATRDEDVLTIVSTGTVALDGAGEGHVELSVEAGVGHGVVQAAYQLTPVGGPMPNLHVSQEVDGAGVFAIAGGAPGKRVSWMVTLMVALKA